MKKSGAILALMLVLKPAFAFNFFDQLCSFNPNWNQYAQRVPIKQAKNFHSDAEYIQAHLGAVLTILSTNPVDHLNAAQRNSRLHLIQLLDAYRLAGNFPINYYRKERIPVFIDPNNTHCAVGYLLQQTGHEDIALRIAAKDNYVWVKDIDDEALIQWRGSSGLSLDELKLIQGAYDFYMPRRAQRYLNPYEIPQQPACIETYFETVNKKGKKHKTGYTWCKGEGINNILDGRWEQNYAIGMPWIVGYFENGERTGQWMEYYKGTKQLCRTEHWSNNKLNGVRKRFDRTGELIEEIMFEDGNAVTKTNYDREQSMTWVRRPIDSTNVYTEVYTNGKLIAKGHETVYNPGNLLWFQNIELTALNSAAVSSRAVVLNGSALNISPARSIRPFEQQQVYDAPQLYNTPPLVQYKKQGDWIYYKDCLPEIKPVNFPDLIVNYFYRDYRHFGGMFVQGLQAFRDQSIIGNYDSIKVSFSNNLMKDLYGYGKKDYTHLYLDYYDEPVYLFSRSSETTPVVKVAGHYDRNHAMTGVWNHYLQNGQLYKTEQFILPRKEEEEYLTTVANTRP